MKFSLIALAATAFAVASAADCDLTKIAPLLTDPNVATCTSDSGFSFTAPTTPTGETLTKVCASTACQNVLAAVKALGLGDCTVLGIQLETDLLNPIATGCAGGSASLTAGSSAGSSSTVTTAPTVGSTTAPTATTSSGSSASSSTVDTPATTATPTPTTTASSASSVTMAATSAAVVAITAAFL